MSFVARVSVFVSCLAMEPEPASFSSCLPVTRIICSRFMALATKTSLRYSAVTFFAWSSRRSWFCFCVGRCVCSLKNINTHKVSGLTSADGTRRPRVDLLCALVGSGARELDKISLFCVHVQYLCVSFYICFVCIIYPSVNRR